MDNSKLEAEVIPKRMKSKLGHKKTKLMTHSPKRFLHQLVFVENPLIKKYQSSGCMLAQKASQV